MKVKDLMTRETIVAEVPGSRRDVLKLLVQHSVSGLPVVRSGTRALAGVVTRSDLLAKPQEEQLALVMSREPVTLPPDADVVDAARIFHQRRIHGIPIVDGADLVGVLSPTDLLRAPHVYGKSVEHFITDHVVPVYELTPIRVAWQMMRLTDVGALPVMDEDAALVGIVADSDLFRESGIEEGVAKHEMGVTEGDLDEDSIRDIAPLYYAKSQVGLPKRPVKDVMVRKVITVLQRSSAEDAAVKMAKARVNQLPVVDSDGRLVGMVTDLDLMRAWFA